jgi:hypothetical protein
MATLPSTPQDQAMTQPHPAERPADHAADRAVEDGRALVKDASAGKLTPERRDRVRQRALAETPRWYSPYAHLAATTGIGLVTLAISATMLSTSAGARPVATDWLVVPIVCLLANFFEWRVHKHVLHRRRWPLQYIYDQHTPMHHMIYVEDDMALRSVAEFRLVLIPAAGVLGIVVAAAPFALAVGHFWSAAAGWLFLVTASSYMVAYEVLHLCYHAPHHTLIGRSRIIRFLAKWHSKHHDPRFMQRWNFNVIFPFFDFLMGTMAGDDPQDKRRYLHWR